MNILWLTWKDYTHPQAGGAEVVLRELSTRLVGEGHRVTFLTVRHPGSAKRESLDGIDIIRVGRSRYIHPFQALAHYMRRLRGKYDVIIEVVNTAPYFGVLFGGGAKTFLFYHQLAREIWFHETKAPLSYFGYHVLEPLANRMLARAKAQVITISNSTRQDLARFGFKPERARIISEGIEIEHLKTLRSIEKFVQPTLLSFGAIRGMKRTLDQVKAFEIAKQNVPQLRMIIAGDDSGPYAQAVLGHIAKSPFGADITVEGRVSKDRKIELMRRAHVIVVSSVKEGWGLIITEAASQGTPAVVYDADGLRDSVRHQQTGLITKQNPQALATGITQLLQNQTVYQNMRRAAWRWSKQITFEQSYQDFKQALGVI
jgi:glycosyltransferase involved in cell wall biosynthesis